MGGRKHGNTWVFGYLGAWEAECRSSPMMCAACANVRSEGLQNASQILGKLPTPQKTAILGRF